MTYHNRTAEKFGQHPGQDSHTLEIPEEYRDSLKIGANCGAVRRELFRIDGQLAETIRRWASLPVAVQDAISAIAEATGSCGAEAATEAVSTRQAMARTTLDRECV